MRHGEDIFSRIRESNLQQQRNIALDFNNPVVPSDISIETSRLNTQSNLCTEISWDDVRRQLADLSRFENSYISEMSSMYYTRTPYFRRSPNNNLPTLPSIIEQKCRDRIFKKQLDEQVSLLSTLKNRTTTESSSFNWERWF